MGFLGKRDHRIPVLADQLHALEQRVRHLEDDVVSLADRYERLRGRFYAKVGPTSPPEPESKASILRRMGYMGQGRSE